MTRCLIIFKDERGRELAVLYRNGDGYPEGTGMALARSCAGVENRAAFIMGYRRPHMNGMDAIACNIIHDLVAVQHNFRLYPAGTRGAGEDYIYTVYGELNAEPKIRCEDPPDEKNPKVYFDCPASEAILCIQRDFDG